MTSVISTIKPLLAVQSLTKSFVDLKKPALHDVSFILNRGEVVCLVGPSGSGKTTLLRTLGGLEVADGGAVNAVAPEQGSVLDVRRAFVAQDFNLWSHKTVLENIILAPMVVQGVSRDKAEAEALALLTRFGLADKKDSYPEFLSGGQKQRVAIIRALATKPDILFLDEITSALDPELVSGILDLIRVLAKDGQSMIIATHHLKFATEVANRILFLEHGRIIQESTVKDFIYAQHNERINEFIKTLGFGKQEIMVYEGFDQFQAFQLGILKRSKPGSVQCVMGSSGDRWYEAMGEYYEAYEKLRLEKKIVWKMIMYEESPRDRDTRLHDPELNSYRFLPKHVQNPANYYVTDDVVVIQIFGTSGEAPAIIEIKNQHVATSYQNYFNLLWEQGTPISPVVSSLP